MNLEVTNRMDTLGNTSLLSQSTHGFLCSRCTKSSAILPCLDWASSMAHGNTPVMSTFHSEMENAVLDILLRGTCPIILVLGRCIYKDIPDKLKNALDTNRLLIVSISNQQRITKASALRCNEYICNTASHLTFGFVSNNSSLFPLFQKTQNKQCLIFNELN